MKIPNKQLSAKMLVIYMISALLFLTSIELHIHTQEAASVADHGSSVSVSKFNTDGTTDEITVSPDGILKLQQATFNLFLMLLFIGVVSSVQRCIRISRLRVDNAQIPCIPFQGTPPLRAPPQ